MENTLIDMGWWNLIMQRQKGRLRPKANKLFCAQFGRVKRSHAPSCSCLEILKRDTDSKSRNSCSANVSFAAPKKPSKRSWVWLSSNEALWPLTNMLLRCTTPPHKCATHLALISGTGTPAASDLLGSFTKTLFFFFVSARSVVKMSCPTLEQTKFQSEMILSGGFRKLHLGLHLRTKYENKSAPSAQHNWVFFKAQKNISTEHRKRESFPSFISQRSIHFINATSHLKGKYVIFVRGLSSSSDGSVNYACD